MLIGGRLRVSTGSENSVSRENELKRDDGFDEKRWRVPSISPKAYYGIFTHEITKNTSFTLN